MSLRRWLGPILVTLLVTAMEPVWAVPASAEDGRQKVLVVYSTRRSTQFSTTGDRILPGLLNAGPGRGVDYAAEYIDGARFPEAEYPQAFRDYLALKYHDVRFDLIVAMHGLAYEFVTTYRDELFPGVPLVFFTDIEPQRVGHSAGIVEARNYRPSLDLALAIQPDTRDVFVVIGSSTRDAAAERVVRVQFASYTPRLRVTYLSGLSMDAVEQRLRTMPEHAIAYFVLFYQDAAGVNVAPLQYLDRVSAVANRPVYSWVDSAMNHGVVGGGVTSIELQIRAVAQLAARVLRGETADRIPVLRLNTVSDQVDWRQLQRWGLTESRLPSGSRILFRPPTAWDRYNDYIVGALLLALVQSGLIVLLLVQRHRLRRAEAIVRDEQADLTEARARVRDLGGRLLAAQDAERSRIAFELHDDIGQQLAALMINLEVLCGFGRRSDGAEVVAREALGHADTLSRSLHGLSHRLYPARLPLLGLVPALSGLARDMTTASVDVRFTHRAVPAGLSQELTLALYRVVQEALRNAIVHSGASRVRVHLERLPDALVMTVEDDGVGFDVPGAMNGGLGLISMHERIGLLGGTLTIASTRGVGTRIETVIADSAPRASVAV